MVARDFDMTPAPMDIPHVLGDGTVVLGYYVRYRPRDHTVPGSDSYIALFVYGEPEPLRVEYRILDYFNDFKGSETEFAAKLRQAIEKRLAELAPGEEVKVSHARFRTLPP